jgi:hypothetical protein
MLALWPSPVRSHVACPFDCPFAAVLVLPKAAMQEALKAMEQQHIRRVIDACCRIPALRHMETMSIAEMAPYCRVRLCSNSYDVLCRMVCHI